MNLYEIYNGYTGYGSVHVIVLAENDEKAKELASEQLKESAKRESYERDMKLYTERGWDTKNLKEYMYPESYWTELKVETLCEDIENIEYFTTGVRE
ncbi:hypothetical protein [Priestia megaterium]|uniref:hypothetical protein n=1 Tax=Priestia megaterium TaxID=1404 RepID=UPI003CC60349